MLPQVRHESVIDAGLLLVPQGVGALPPRTTGGLADRVGPRPVAVTGLLPTAAGTLPFAAGSGNGLLLGTALLVRGLGMSSASLAVLVGAFPDLPAAHVPHTGTTTRVLQQLGGSFGTGRRAPSPLKWQPPNPGLSVTS